MGRSLIITLTLALALAAASPQAGAAAVAAPHVHPATGHWAGFAQSGVGNPNEGGVGNSNDAPAPFSVDIASHSGPHVRGELVGLGGPDTKSSLTGVVSPSGRAALLGLGPGGTSVINWSPAALADVPGIQPCIFDGRYLRLGRALADRGPLVVVHQMRDPSAPSIGGAWRGSTQGIGNPEIRPVEAQFAQTADGILAGRLTLGSGEAAATFELTGHAAALDEGGVGLQMVGGGDGMIIINGRGDGSVRELRLSYRWIGAPGGPHVVEEGAIIING